MERSHRRLRALLGLCVITSLALLATVPPHAVRGAERPPAPDRAATDSLGDALPDYAKLRLGTLRFHAPSTVVDMALSPNEKTVVTVGDHLIVWDAETGKELWKAGARENGLDLPAAAYGIRAVAFTSDSQHFYTSGRRNEVILWDVASDHHEVLRISQRSRSKAVDLSANGQKLAVGNADGVVVCDEKGQVLFEIANKPKGSIDTNSSADRLLFGGHYSFGRFSPDSKILAVVTSDAPEEVRLVDAESGKELRRVPLKSRLVRMAFSPDGKNLATTERDSAVRLYGVESGKEMWSHVFDLKNPYENYTSAVAYSPDGKLLAAGATDNRIHLLDATTGVEAASLSGSAWYPWSLAFTADSKKLYSSGWDGAVRRWDIASRTQLPLPKGIHATGVTAASPDGRMIAYEDDAGAIRLVSVKDGTEQAKLERPKTEYSQLTYSPDGLLLAGGGTSGSSVHVTIWELSSKKAIHHWEWAKGRDPHSTVEAISFSPQGDRVAAAVFRQSAAYIWDLKKDQQIAKLKHSEVYGLSFSPDGATLATAGWDEKVRFWDGQTGKLSKEVKVKNEQQNNGDTRMYAVCYAPGGDLLATAQLDGKVRVWNVADMSPQKEFQVSGRFIYGAMSFSPDGLWLATGAMDGSVTLWDPLTAEKVWDFGRHQGYVYTVGFGRDWRTLLSGGEDGVCYLWDLRPSKKPADTDLAGCWDALAEKNGVAAYQAMWDLSDARERAVSLLAEKLRPVKTVVEPERAGEGLSVEEEARLNDQKRLLDNKDETVQSSLTVRRAVSLLTEIGTPEATQLLKELADRDPDGYVGRLAAAALKQRR